MINYNELKSSELKSNEINNNLEEEVELFSLNGLRQMQIIDINVGRILGNIYDLKIDCDNFKIVSIYVLRDRPKLFGNVDLVEIPWENIKKIGIDVILVDCECKNDKL